MMGWIRANTVLVLGVALPVVLVLIFVAAAVVPRLLVEPPRHDFLFLANEYGPARCCQYRFRVRDGRLRVETQVVSKQTFTAEYHLFRFDAGTLSTSEIPLPEPVAGEDGESWRIVEIEAVAGLRLDSANLSPDGYRISVGRRSRGVLPGLFYSSHGNGTGLAITRSGRTVVIPAAPLIRGQYGGKFLGWVVGED